MFGRLPGRGRLNGEFSDAARAMVAPLRWLVMGFFGVEIGTDHCGADGRWRARRCGREAAHLAPSPNRAGLDPALGGDRVPEFVLGDVAPSVASRGGRLAAGVPMVAGSKIER